MVLCPSRICGVPISWNTIDQHLSTFWFWTWFDVLKSILSITSNGFIGLILNEVTYAFHIAWYPVDIDTVICVSYLSSLSCMDSAFHRHNFQECSINTRIIGWLPTSNERMLKDMRKNHRYINMWKRELRAHFSIVLLTFIYRYL